MATIALFPFPEEGHIIPMLALGRTLQEQGHEVFYLVLPDLVDFVRGQGFECVPIMEDVFPRGSREKSIRNQIALKPGFSSKQGRQAFRELLYNMMHMQFQETLCAELLQKDAEESMAFLGAKRPDMIFVDALTPSLALMTHAAALPTILLWVSMTTSYEAEPSLPPISVGLIPRQTLFSRLMVRLSWPGTLLLKNLGCRLLHVTIDQSIHNVARHYQFPLERIEDTPFFPRLRPDPTMPELILCPRALDFPHADRENTFYMNSSFHIAPRENSFPWDKVAQDKPLIFCALGSQSHLFIQSLSFFQTVIKAAAQRPQWQFVLATGRYFDRKVLQTSGIDNIVIVEWAPQLQLLQRAALMIHHGGMGTIIDCIRYEVPMISYPALRDGAGNAARVTYHKLGVMGNIMKLSPPRMLALIDKVMGDPSFRENLRVMKQKLQDSDEAESRTVLNHLLAGLLQVAESSGQNLS
jgi:zeaxanthin glucosyltransferase